MFSKLVGLIQSLYKMKKNGQKKKTKKLVNQSRGKAKSKKVSVVEEVKATKNDPDVKKSKLKEVSIRAKIIFLGIVKWILAVIEAFIKWIIATLGIFGFFIVLAVIVIMIAIYGFLHIDMSIGDNSFYSGNNSNSDCVQGSQVIQSTEFTVDSLKTFNGNFTENQLNQLRVLQIYSELIHGKNVDEMWSKDFAEFKNFFDSTQLLQYFFGLYAMKTDFAFGGAKDITKEALSNDLLDVNSLLKIDSSNYSGIKSIYSSPSGLSVDSYFIPYGITLQMESFERNNGSYPGYLVKASEKVEAYWDTISSEIVAKYNEGMDSKLEYLTADENLKNYLILYLATSMYFTSYDFDSADDTFYTNLFSLWCSLWFNNTDFSVWVIGGTSHNLNEIKNSSKLNGSSTNYFSIGGTALDDTLLDWISQNTLNQEYFDSTAKVLLDSLSENDLMITYCGIVAKGLGAAIIDDLGKVAPLVVGGNAEDCDCYGSGSSYTGNIGFNVNVGTIQGPWDETTRAYLESQPQSVKDLYGAAVAFKIPEYSQNTYIGSGTSLETWRQNTKWKVPYYYQVVSQVGGEYVTENGGKDDVLKIYTTSSTANWFLKFGCHTFMASYMASALTGSVITPVEMIPALHKYEGILANGYFSSAGVTTTFDKLGLNFISVSATGPKVDATLTQFGFTSTELKSTKSDVVQKVVNAVLDNNGLYGMAAGSPFTGNVNHYVVISERVGDKYRIVQYRDKDAVSDSNPDDLYSWDVIYRAMGNHSDSDYDFQRFIAWNPNLSSVGNMGITSSSGGLNFVGLTPKVVIEVPKIYPQQGIIKDAEHVNRNWNSTSRQKVINDLWKAQPASEQYEGVLAKYKGLFMVAMGYKFATPEDPTNPTGSVVIIELEDGSLIPAILGDTKAIPNLEEYGGTPMTVDFDYKGKHYNFEARKKGDEYACEWSHLSAVKNGFVVSYVEWMFESPNHRDGDYEDIVFPDNWANKEVVRVYNYGNYKDLSDEDIARVVAARKGKGSGASGTVNCISSGSSYVNGGFSGVSGEFQGPWGDLSKYVDMMKDGPTKTNTQKLLPYVGMKPIHEGKEIYNYAQDKWRNINGSGYVRYAQYSPYINDKNWEEYATLTGGSTGNSLKTAGCGCFAVSSVLSTMLGKYINPCEVSIALNTWDLWNNGETISGGLNHLGSDGVYGVWELEAVVKKAGFNGETRLIKNGSQGDLDSFLDKDGLVILVATPNGPLKHTFVNGSGHYIVVREKVSDGHYLIYSSTNWSTKEGTTDAYYNANRVVTYEELTGTESNNGVQTLWISR